jgi:glucose/arabinose dehydrogenase
MNKRFVAALLFPLIYLFFSCNPSSNKPRVLVFSKSQSYRHASIGKGKLALQKLGKEYGFDVDTTENGDVFNEEGLKKYAAVVFLCTTGDVLNYDEEVAFERFIQSGGGFAGIHSATDTELDWGWFEDLTGGSFQNHPDVQPAIITVVDSTHPSTKDLPTTWKTTDEWYNFKRLNNDIKPLLTIDEKTYKGGTMGDKHPIAWYHEFDGGRSFCTSLGHTEESYSDSLFLKHILGGIQYAIGNNKLDYSKTKSVYPPDERKFTKTVLSEGKFFEPTEMTVLPNLDILIVERRGQILLYKYETKQIKPAGLLNVYWETQHTAGVNAEEGLLGICKDPNFARNNYVYIFYSPSDTSVNRLSRFELKNDSIDNRSEKIVLQFYSQREICCHTGGSIAFGPDGILYVSTGDNSTPFDEKGQPFVNRGFAPLDDRPGHEQYNARRTASNSNDLRGKIIRIRIKPDGSYEIPDGNLFPKNEPATKPEIYVMGNRNPYRIAVDQKNSYLYWGEVGPDSNVDSFETRGPRGYDEINQARKAGYFGWPLFIGDNYPYHNYDYITGTTGPLFDPSKPVNNAHSNTGIKNLPPSQPAFIWYPYVLSQDFPDMAMGGRTAMAGPVYYADMYPAETRLPEYYNGKLFIYEWMRNFIKVVTLRPNGNFYKMEPFMEKTKFAAPVDMELGPDGKLYILEYGTGWFSQNKDSGLSRIDFTK